MTNEIDRLSELVRLERRSARDCVRIERGWERLHAAVGSGTYVIQDLSSSRQLRVASIRGAARRAMLCAVGALVIAGSGGLWRYSASHFSKAVPAPVNSRASSDVEPQVESIVTVETTNDETASEREPAENVVRANVPRAAVGPKWSGTSPSSSDGSAADSFEKELALIKAAKSQLDQGHAAGALSLVTKHARAYPKGVFSGEREALRLLATCSSLARAERESLVREFARAYPSSPYVDRIRRLCDPNDKAGP